MSAKQAHNDAQLHSCSMLMDSLLCIHCTSGVQPIPNHVCKLSLIDDMTENVCAGTAGSRGVCVQHIVQESDKH